MTRIQLPNRRTGITVKVAWNGITGGPDHKLLVTFGWDHNDHTSTIKEAFIASFRAEATFVALVNDACIFYSRCLQHGDTVEELATSCHENIKEGEHAGPPASMLGEVARTALKVQRYLRGEELPPAFTIVKE